MAYLSPIGNEVQTDSNGDPLSGGEIWTYLAGTSTEAATYTTQAGAVEQENPIELNASGLPANPIWLTGGQEYKFVIKDAQGNTLRTVDDISGINDPGFSATIDQWVTYSDDPTYISATSFSVTGDQTNTFQVGRRLKSTNTGGTIYSSITASSYNSGTGLTTVTVANDSGSLDSGISAVSYGLLSVTGHSFPTASASQAAAGTSNDVALTPSSLKSGQIVAGTAVTASGTSVDFTGIPSWAKRVTIMLAGVSTNGTSNPLIQLGDSGGIEATGYLGSSGGGSDTASLSVANYTTGFGINSGAAANVLHGSIVLTRLDSATNTWTANGVVGYSSGATFLVVAGSKALSATLTQVRITTVGGVNTFDAGSINVLYE